MISPVLDITKKTIFCQTLPALIQYAQAHKKPRWVPVAKSKIFRIPKRPVVSEEERLELLRINNNYKTQMRAIRQFYHEEMLKEKSSRQSASSDESLRREADEWERCVELNERWNAEVAIERDSRRAQQLEEMEQFALKRMENKDRELEQLVTKASQEIIKEKELSSTFLTVDSLDEAIEYALANPVDYNFAINLNGEVFHGRDPTVTHKTEKIQSAKKVL